MPTNRRIIVIAVLLFLLIGISSYGIYLYLSPGSPIQRIVSYTPRLFGGKPFTNSCIPGPYTIGNKSITISSGGLKRSFILHLAPSYGTQPQPVVINYHGYSYTDTKMAQYSNMASEADKAGFVLLFPQGVDSPPSWNAGVGAQGPTGDADDIQFTRDMLTYLEQNYCVDSHRIYLTGFSLGGGMAYRAACTLSNQIAAIATVAGAYYPFPGGCHPSRPLSVLEIHGQADTFAPYTGNPAAKMSSVQDYLNAWLGYDRCSQTSQVIFQHSDVTAFEWKHCASGTSVEHYQVSDGGHTWPGAATNTVLGYVTHTIDANVVIWNFLSHYSS